MSSEIFRVVPVRLGISNVAGVLSYAAAIRLLAWDSVMGNVRLMWRELEKPRGRSRWTLKAPWGIQTQ